jgi:hypothetical protein
MLQTLPITSIKRQLKILMEQRHATDLVQGTDAAMNAGPFQLDSITVPSSIAK